MKDCDEESTEQALMEERKCIFYLRPDRTHTVYEECPDCSFFSLF